MRRVAFHAPMKPPTHPVPSGDRAFARALMSAIATETARVDLISTVQTHEKRGCATRQAEIRQQATAEAEHLIARLSQNPPDLWVTYHNYYKAPDLIGHAVTTALDIPYVQIESSRSKKRLDGPWAEFATAAEAAIDAADIVFYLTANDLITLDRHRPESQRLVHLRPFLPRPDLPPVTDPGRNIPTILTAAMMREGDKLASYRIIAEALSHLNVENWRLLIAGDGPARAEVERLMAPYGNHVRFLGQLDADAMTATYAQAALFLWPGVNEGFGMVYLEAQAAGLPVAAQDRPGVRDVLAPGHYPAPEQGAAALADHIITLLSDPEACQRQGAIARDTIARHHLMDSARATFWSAVTPLLEPAR